MRFVIELFEEVRAVWADEKALGMRVLATRRRQKPHPAVDALHPPEALAQIIGEADIVSVHLRADASTRHAIDARMFAAMKPGAKLINTSRGSIVDEAALVAALASGHLGGAYLDVFETEPLPSSSPLWSFPNVLLTPHTADSVGDWPARFARHFGDNLERWNAGARLLNVVKP
jgi:phosphoglycerate dehydrogenase-like enzyme